MPIDLPDVTLVMVDGVARPLSEWALAETLRQIQPASVRFLDETPKTVIEADKLLWKTCAGAETSHVLTMQYDGFVVDPAMWKPEFLKYDYIGAVWPHRPDTPVGNGGFSLRSTKLMRFLAENVAQETPEDYAICVTHRERIEKAGFKFAPAGLAHQFSFERCPKRRSFGTHGIFNMPKVLSKPKLDEWMALANDYVRGKPEWAELEVQLA